MQSKLSKKGQELIEMYKHMISGGYMRKDGIDIRDAFADFESRFYRIPIKEQFIEFNIESTLDYGCGGSDWTSKNFDDNGQSAQEYYGLDKCFRYEPARGFDERAKADCVISFDVLEHVYIADVENILDDIFSYAKKLVILNIACYPANAMLPNGENAHITVRDKFWWKAQLDICALKYPNIHIQLLTSRDWRKTESFPVYRGQDWLDSDKFVTS
jgi:hypothetical protein